MPLHIFCSFSLKLFFVLLLICRNPSHSENINRCPMCGSNTDNTSEQKNNDCLSLHMEICNCSIRFVFLSFEVSCFMSSNEMLLSTEKIKLKCSSYNNSFQLIFNPFKLY